MLNFLYTAVSWVLLQWHHLFNVIGLDPNGGLNWALSIVFLVITARLLLFRLFVKQVHYQRHMQQMQPEIQKLRKKYKDDKAEMQRQMMKLQQEQGFNPLAGCLPMFLQFPVFIGLYHVLRHLSNSVVAVHTLQSSGVGALSTDQVRQLTLYGFTQSETASAATARLFGAPLAAQLIDSPQKLQALGGEVTVTRAVIVILVLISATATFMTQRLVRAGQLTAPEGTAATIQKLMMYLIPVGTLGSGLFFPMGVLLYWFSSNTWTMGQQLYINKFHPHTAPVAATSAGTIGKTLAPKPGQRPVRPSRAGAPPLADVDPVEEPFGGGETDQSSVGRNAPRPGQRPQRPAGQRPPAKRPTQAKKRR